MRCIAWPGNLRWTCGWSATRWRPAETTVHEVVTVVEPDVAAFAKNAGPRALRIDYLTDQRRLSLYTPDFMARKTDGTYLLIETKGRVDKDVPLKASAAVGCCKAASAAGERWEYLYVPEGVFLAFGGDLVEDLESVCATHLADSPRSLGRLMMRPRLCCKASSPMPCRQENPR